MLFRTHEFDAIAGAHPGVAGHAAHGVECGRVDAEVVLQMCCDVNANDLAQDYDACALSLAGVPAIARYLGRRSRLASSSPIVHPI